VTALTREAALRFVGWARVWSPTAPKEMRVEAWDALGLPESFEEVEPTYWATFHVGSPAPPVPLFFHAALGMEGGHAREEWMRVLSFLGLQWKEGTLPPDHLAPSCEALATAIEREDEVMVSELCERFFLPWCERASERLADETDSMRALAECFQSDLRRLGVSSSRN